MLKAIGEFVSMFGISDCPCLKYSLSIKRLALFFYGCDQNIAWCWRGSQISLLFARLWESI
jgi:hypothetical protein